MRRREAERYGKSYGLRKKKDINLKVGRSSEGRLRTGLRGYWEGKGRSYEGRGEERKGARSMRAKR